MATNTGTRRNADADAEAAAARDAANDAAAEDAANAAVEDSATETDSPAGDAMSAEDREIADLEAAIAEATAKRDAATAAKAARVRAEVMAGITEATTEMLTASQAGDAETVQARWASIGDQLRANGQALGLVVAVQRGTRRTSNGGTPRAPRSGGHREEILGWLRQHPNQDGMVPTFFANMFGRSPGHSRDTLVGARFIQGEPGGLLQGGYVKLAQSYLDGGPLAVDAVPSALATPAVLAGTTN